MNATKNYTEAYQLTKQFSDATLRLRIKEYKRYVKSSTGQRKQANEEVLRGLQDGMKDREDKG